MKKIKFFIIYLFLISNVFGSEIKIISDTQGNGKKIINHSWVQLEYTGYFEDGKVFDSNVGKDSPLVVQIGMNEVIPGFEQAIIGTKKGTVRKVIIPPELAYGKKGVKDIIPANAVLIFEFKVIDVLDPNYNLITSSEVIKKIENNAVVLDIRTEEECIRTGIIKGSFKQTAFEKNGKFNVFLMDKVRALAGADSQNIDLTFVSHDGKTASILANAFAEDLGFKKVSVLDKGIKGWIEEKKELISYK